MRHAVIVLVLALCASFLPACGGGGTGEGPAPQQPGTLRTVALEGAAAPQGGGAFLPFATRPPMDVAAGGWSVFVADTSLLGDVVYVYTPDGALLRVFAQGDAAPDLATGSIAGISRVWVNADGTVLALVSVSGNAFSITQGLVTARAAETGVTDVAAVIYDLTPMDGTGVSGDLAQLTPSQIHLGSDDTVFFGGETDGFETALWRADPDGQNLRRVVGTGEPLPGGLSVVTVLATQISNTATSVGLIVERTDGLLGVYTGSVATRLFDEVAAEGDPLLGSDVVADFPLPQALVVYAGSEGSSIVYEAVSDAGEDHLLVGRPNLPDYLVAKQGAADTQITGGVFGALKWLENDRGAEHPLFQARMSGAQGITFAIYALESVNLQTGRATLSLAAYDGRPLEQGTGELGALFPGLGDETLRDASASSSFAFANVLATGDDVGLFWLIRGTGFFTTARSGQEIPGGGDTYLNDTSWRSTTANGVVLFRAPLTTAGSGIFRRGP